jgi:hypothetical protein
MRGRSGFATVKEIIWTQGAHDIVTIVEAPDDETASAFILSADELGNVRSEIMRGFTAAEMEKLLAKDGEPRDPTGPEAHGALRRDHGSVSSREGVCRVSGQGLRRRPRRHVGLQRHLPVRTRRRPAAPQRR